MSKFTNMFAAAIIAALTLGVFANQASAKSLAEIIAEGGVNAGPNRPIVLEDGNYNAVIDANGNTTSDLAVGNYIITVAEFQALTSNRTTLDEVPFAFDAVTGDTAGLDPVPPQAALGNGTNSDTAINAVIFGQIASINVNEFGDGFITVGAANAPALGGLLTGVDLSAFAGGVMVEVYQQDNATAADWLVGNVIADDVANARGGTQIATFGLAGDAGEFYTLVVQNGRISDFGLSLSLFTNNTGLPIYENNFGTELFAEGGDFSSLGQTSSQWQSFGDGDAGIVVVPTPAALPAGLGLLALATLRRRRNG